jgi:hypothetical protein
LTFCSRCISISIRVNVSERDFSANRLDGGGA